MSSFLERQKNLFNHLKNAEEHCDFYKQNVPATPEVQNYGTVDKQTYRKLKKEMKQFKGRESIFKKEQSTILECLCPKRTPGFMKNPQKWVYYSLSDVSPEQMSDSTNKATAIAFIQELEEKFVKDTDMEQTSDDLLFKKPKFLVSSAIRTRVKRNETINEEKPTFKSSKIIMPEYVVGVSQKKEKKANLGVKKPNDKLHTEKKLELKLNHLYEDDE